MEKKLTIADYVKLSISHLFEGEEYKFNNQIEKMLNSPATIVADIQYDGKKLSFTMVIESDGKEVN